MENETNIIPKNPFEEYRKIFEEFLDGSDMDRISKKARVSQRTVYTYINKSIPDNVGAETIAKTILDEALIILNEKKSKLEKI